MAFKWTCPFCKLTQAVVDSQTRRRMLDLRIQNQVEGPLALWAQAIGCSNPECLHTAVHVELANGKTEMGNYLFDDSSEKLFDQSIRPQGDAKPQPAYIPEAIREDYYEACLIRDLSPKASATLTRRCLQGMIRNFAGITGATLFAEIDALRGAVEDRTADRAVTPETVEAIDHVRGVGNIGAHMEKDIDLIVPVEAGEAQALIELVEMLFDEWYGARQRRKERLARIERIAVEKKALKGALLAATAVVAPSAPAGGQRPGPEMAE